MKKVLSLLFVFIIIFTLAGCKEDPAKSYTITLELNGGSGPTALVVEEGKEITVPAITKSGYTFVDWYSDVELTTVYVLGTMPSNDITIYASWSENLFDVTLSANIEGATPFKTRVVNEGSDDQIWTITAPTIAYYDFQYWHFVGDSAVLSLDLSFEYTATADVEIEAFYTERIVVVEPTLFYETGFEDGAKASYATAPLDLSGETWDFNDALVGSLATDLSVSGNSVRIRDGYIATEFTATNIAQIIFHAGTYGNDDNGAVEFQLSTDKVNWTTVDTFTTTGELEEHNYVFDDAMWTSLGLTKSSSYYIRITSSSSGRTNIDDLQIYTGEGQIVDNTPLYVIDADGVTKSYLVDEIVDLTGCVATHPTTGDTACDITGTVDNTVAGAYPITFYKIDEFGNKAEITINIIIVNENTSDYLTWDLMTYYDDAEGLYGQLLMDELHDILNDGFSGVTYGEARYILDDSDRDPNNSSNLILVYLGTSINGNWDSGSTWNREHVWPQSLLGVSADNGTVNSASDLYNLMPSNPGENSSRGNSPYSEMGLGYEPRDERKGDVARALFYMMMMYSELDLVDEAPGVGEMGYLSELLQWHIEDPVDDFELNRLEVIASEQNNRNPFVDYPHFVELIWFHE